jgi:glycosyltransferase involved in cell wall biosynthesis
MTRRISVSLAVWLGRGPKNVPAGGLDFNADSALVERQLPHSPAHRTWRSACLITRTASIERRILLSDTTQENDISLHRPWSGSGPLRGRATSTSGESFGGMPACSIVMPVFNGEQFLEAALKSIFVQSVANFEVLVVDDGSIDDTAQILARMADPRLKVLKRPHLGIVAALNAGVEAALTDLIVRLDADDLMAANRLERQLAYMDANPTLGGAGSFFTIIDEFGEVHGTHESPLTHLEALDRYLDGGGNPIFPHPSMIFRKSMSLSVGGYREEFRKAEDVDLFLRMIEAGHYILMQPEYLTFVRYHGSSIVATSEREQFDLNELLFSNFHRRRSSLPQISLDEFRMSLSRLSLIRRLLRELRFLSRVLLRRRDIAKLREKPIAAVAWLIGAVACNPTAALGKLRRSAALVRAKRRSFQDPETEGRRASHAGP